MNQDFDLHIEMGNETMQNGFDLASALRKVASRVASGGGFSGLILDDNGNSVGNYRLYPTERELSDDRS